MYSPVGKKLSTLRVVVGLISSYGSNDGGIVWMLRYILLGKGLEVNAAKK